LDIAKSWGSDFMGLVSYFNDAQNLLSFPRIVLFRGI